MSEPQYKEGNLVHYAGLSHLGFSFWIYAIKGNKLTLVPQGNLDWEDGVLRLTDAFQVDASKVRLISDESN